MLDHPEATVNVRRANVASDQVLRVSFPRLVRDVVARCRQRRRQVRDDVISLLPGAV